MHFAGQKLLVRWSEDGQHVETPDQAVVTSEDGSTKHILLFPEMTPEGLKRSFRKKGITEGSEKFLLFKEEDCPRYLKLFNDAFPEAPVSPHSTMLPGTHLDELIECNLEVTDHYFRAVAKIAFHYYLVHSDRGLGNEEGLVDVRNFILNGGPVEGIFSGSPQFRVPFPQGFAPARWCHFLAAHEAEGMVFAYVRLFCGPESNGLEYDLLLGRPGFKLDLPNSVWAHTYVYDDPPGDRGKVGEVHETRTTKYRIYGL